MSENKGKNTNIDNAKDSIDDFAQALLDKKTEMALFKEENIDENESIDPNDRKQAEETMKSALDLLRKERGQKSIDLEEYEYLKQEEKIKEASDIEDFTTSSLENPDFLNSSIKNIADILNEEQNEKDEEEIVEEDEKKSMSKKKKILLSLGFIVLVLSLMLGYAYKIYVYDPQNVISREQEEIYNKFILYADEYSDDMLSDVEKLELLDMQSEYDTLIEKQKESLDVYFKEQTGKNYKKIYDELLALKKQQEDENNPDYKEIESYLTNWTQKDEAQKMNVINLKSKYDSLSTGLQKKVDTLSREQTGKSFIALHSEYEKIKKEQDEEAKRQQEQQNNETIAYYQSLINETNIELQNYIGYQASLEAELNEALASGLDITEIQSQIDMNQQLIDQCNSYIDAYTAEINKYQ